MAFCPVISEETEGEALKYPLDTCGAHSMYRITTTVYVQHHLATLLPPNGSAHTCNIELRCLL